MRKKKKVIKPPFFYMMGDIHGNYKTVRDFWLRAKLSEKMAEKDNILICLGDFGANYFMNERDKQFKDKLGKYPFTYFVIRGNHEERPSVMMSKNPSAWHYEGFQGGIVMVENEYPYIKYAMDYPSLYMIDGFKTLVLPGAYSVDKYHRLRMGWAWFEGEQMTVDEMLMGHHLVDAIGYKCDLVLSHTCPIIYEPTDLFLSVVDQSMVDKTTERFLGDIEYKLDYRAWCWGHYHQHREYPSPDGRRRLMLMHEAVRLVDVLEEEGYVEVL